jgi:hypothetical protein
MKLTEATNNTPGWKRNASLGIEYKMTDRGHAQHQYSVRRTKSKWPEPKKLVTALGGSDYLGGHYVVGTMSRTKGEAVPGPTHTEATFIVYTN